MRGCIVRRESGNWAIKLTLGKDPETGRYRQQWIGGFRTKKDAERKLTEVLGQVDSGAFVKPAKLTVAEYMRQWLRDYAEPNLRPRTFEGYKAIVERYVIPSPMGRLKLTDLRPTHLQTYEAAMLKSGSLKTKGGGLSPHTVLQHHRLISEALSHAVRLGLLTRNAADGVKAPHFARKEMTPLDPAGVFRFLDACKGTEYHALFHLDIYTGLRRSEALGLRWKDVDLDLATLSVVQVLHRLKDDQSVWLGTKGVKRRQKDVFLEPITPAETLYLFGAGHIAQATASIGRMLGFRVVVTDPRPEYNNDEKFPGADALYAEDYDSAFKKLPIDENSYIVIVTHGHKGDEIVLAQALKTPAKYIGMIGSKKKVKEIKDRLLARGITQAQLDSVYSPIGLDINAETPEEIAISILAEIIDVRRHNKKKNRPHESHHQDE